MMNVYQPSGKFKPAVFAYALGGAVVAAGLAWIYQLVIDLIPLIYLNLVVTGGFAVALVAIGGLIVNAGHCRNVVVGVAATLIVGVGGVGASHYFAYSSVISSIVEEEGLDEAQAEALKQELSFGVYIEARVETGWSVSRRGRGGAELNGMFVWLIWGLEALILLGGSAFGGFGAAKEPYAEASGEWLEEGEKFMFVSPAADVLQQVIGAQDVDSLLAIHANPGEGDRAAILFEPWRVPGNPVPAYVSVSLRQSEVDDDGEVKFDDTRLHTCVVLTPEQGARLNELSKLGVGVGEDDEETAQAMAAASAPAGTPAPDAAPRVPPGADQSTGEDEQPRA